MRQLLSLFEVVSDTLSCKLYREEPAEDESGSIRALSPAPMLDLISTMVWTEQLWLWYGLMFAIRLASGAVQRTRA